MPYPDIRSVLGLELAGTADEVEPRLAANLDLLQTYAADRTVDRRRAAVWDVDFDGFDVLDDGDVGENGLGYVILPFVVDLRGATSPS